MSRHAEDLHDDADDLDWEDSLWDEMADPDGLGPHARPDLGVTAPLAAALAAASCGGHVFPAHTPMPDGRCSCRRDCGRNAGKHPRLGNGLLGASNDPAVIRAWWRIWPEANVALRTGADSGCFVLDVDPDGFGAFEALCAGHGDPYWNPDTWTVRTGRLGGHLCFRHPGEHVRIKTTAGVLAPGVDVRGDGGYVLLPPSLHAAGRRYEWVDGLAPWEVDLFDPPPWLLNLVVAPPTPSGPTLSGPAAAGAGAPIAEGQRNATLTSLAGSMRRRGFGEAAIAAALTVENLERCRPPLSDVEIARIAASVARYAPSQISPRPSVRLGGETTVRVAGIDLPVRPRERRRA